jgi:hypothetical protein
MFLSLTAGASWGQVYDLSANSFRTVSRNRPDYQYSARGTILSRPTVSPYLGLTDLGTGVIDSSYNYFTSVRPQLQAAEQARQQQRSIAALQQQVSAIQTSTQNRQGARTTGHPTRFLNYAHYYPGFGR